MASALNRDPPQVNSSRKAIRSAKMPSASVTAKPKIRRPNCPSAADGLRSAPCRNCPNRLPTPMAAAPVPMAARPAPMSLAAAGSIEIVSLPRLILMNSRAPPGLVPGMQCVVEIHAGEHGEHIGLQERHQDFEGGQGDGHCQRQRRQRGEAAGAEQHDDEAAEDLE